MVGLIVDNPKRDLDGLVLLAHRLSRSGINTALIPLYQQGVEVPLLGLTGVVVNYARLNNRELLAGYKSRGLQIYVLDTEGGVLSGEGTYTPENWATWLREAGFAGLIDEYFCWGPALAAAFRRLSGIAPEHVHVTGCPRFDFCQAPWRQTLEFPMTDHILVNTSFSGINPFFTSNAVKERAAFRAAGFEDGYIENLLEEQRKAFDGFMDSVDILCRALPEEKILVRPHPFEDPAPYHRRFGAYANATVDGRGNVLNAIARARCVVHLNCGTSVESILLDKLPINVDYLNTGALLTYAPLPRDISYCAKSIEDLVETARDARERSTIFPFAQMRQRYIAPWFSEVDGKAAERVAARIHESRRSPSPGVTSLALSIRGGSLRPTGGQLLQGIAANVLGPAAAARLRATAAPTRRSKVFTDVDVQQVLDRIAQVAPGGHPLRAKRARHPLTRRPMSSVVLAPDEPGTIAGQVGPHSRAG
jgi:surface carbohydrate biosynthesis protein